MNARFFDNWTNQLRKGVLELCILNEINKTKSYGYDIVRKLRRIQGLIISEGVIYPILSRLKRQGLVKTVIRESLEGPPRKYYELTKQGKELLYQMNTYWQAMTNITDSTKKRHKSYK